VASVNPLTATVPGKVSSPSDFKGEPFSEWTLIEYNPELPEDTFKFEIPDDATVIEK
jgi:hypothetical protein